ncbi:MAG: ThuA domain-containing protein [Anaerolineae bacterium]|jgi:type 1 glutamine amidotransferase|nr:ThuA domain-containing protein [Chloroflexota bacterium]
MRVLVLCDDYWHPGKVARAGLAQISSLEWDIIEPAGEWSAEKMSGYPVVLFAKSNEITATQREPWVTPAVEQAFVDYVRAGGGLLAIHSGTVYKQLPTMRALLGGAFDHHPPQCPVTIQPLQGHPLTAGVEPFTVQDEHYHMLLDDAGADVFMTTSSEHGEQPGGWTRLEGQGRVCVLTPGHTEQAFTHPGMSRLICNAVAWCAGE